MSSFMWWGSFTETVDRIPEDLRADFLYGVIQYGTRQIEPNFEFPLDAIFEGIRPNIDSSIKSSEYGKKGGRPSKNKCEKANEETPKKGFSDSNETPKKQQEYKYKQEQEYKHEYKKEEKEEKSSPHFQKPTIEQLKKYIEEKKYSFDAENFWNFYESKGWKVGSSKMKSWKAACATWEKRSVQNHGRDKPNPIPITANQQIFGVDEAAEGWLP